MRIASFTAVTLTLGCVALLFSCVGDDPAATTSPSPTAEAGAEGGSCTKLCSGACAADNDPKTGCSGATCDPCPSAPHRPGVCNTQTVCAVGECEKGYLDCDPAQLGCETLGDTDPKNCGLCGAVCGSLHTSAAPTCVAGKCEFKCGGNFAHCSGDKSTGCESDLGQDPLNCGACGHSCQGGACVAGTCQPVVVVGDPLVATGLVAQYGITVIGTSVYGVSWYSPGTTGGLVFKAPVDGTLKGMAPTWIFDAGVSASATGIFSNGTDFAFGIYRQDPGGPLPGIWSFKTASKAATNIVAGTASLDACPQNPGSSIVSVAYDATYVYWTNQQAPGAPANVNPCPGVYRAGANDGAGVTKFLATDQIDTLLADGGAVYMMDRTDGVLHAAAGATLGTTSSLASFTAGHEFRLAVDDTYAYVADNTLKKVYRVKKVGGGAPADITPAKGTLTDACSAGFVVDDTRVYCAGPAVAGNKIFAFAKDGTSATAPILATVGNGDLTYGPLAQDAQSVYWATAGVAAGTYSAVYKVAK
jgi:hypothetical protein